jgi:hypothetical protein
MQSRDVVGRGDVCRGGMWLDVCRLQRVDTVWRGDAYGGKMSWG